MYTTAPPYNYRRYEEVEVIWPFQTKPDVEWDARWSTTQPWPKPPMAFITDTITNYFVHTSYYVVRGFTVNQVLGAFGDAVNQVTWEILNQLSAAKNLPPIDRPQYNGSPSLIRGITRLASMIKSMHTRKAALAGARNINFMLLGKQGHVDPRLIENVAREIRELERPLYRVSDIMYAIEDVAQCILDNGDRGTYFPSACLLPQMLFRDGMGNAFVMPLDLLAGRDSEWVESEPVRKAVMEILQIYSRALFGDIFFSEHNILFMNLLPWY